MRKNTFTYDNNSSRSKGYQRSLASSKRNPEKRLWTVAKNNAKVTQKEFNIVPEDIIIPSHCPYLGIELTNTVGEGKLDTNPSIDRIDNTKGYIKGNIQVISWLANRMKHKATNEQLIAFARGILKLHDKTN